MNDNRCVCCGEIIPEGMIACPNCLVVSKRGKNMTVKEAFFSIVEDGIAKGAGDFVDPEALEVAAVVMAKAIRGLLVEVVRCKDCKWYENGKSYDAYCNHPTDGMNYSAENDFCSYGERKEDV